MKKNTLFFSMSANNRLLMYNGRRGGGELMDMVATHSFSFELTPSLGMSHKTVSIFLCLSSLKVQESQTLMNHQELHNISLTAHATINRQLCNIFN